MPRFTVIEVDNFPEYEIDAAALSFYLERDMYRHRADVDFASEEELNAALMTWALPGPTTTRMIVEYENISPEQRRIDCLTQQLHFTVNFIENIRFFTESIRYQVPLFVNIDQVGRMNGDIMSPAVLLGILHNRVNRIFRNQDEHAAPPGVAFNQRQSTHTASVHQSVTDSLKKLQQRYRYTLVQEKNVTALKTMLAKLDPKKDFPELDPRIVNAAQRSRETLAKMLDDQEAGSGLTVKYIIALVWAAIQDENSLALLSVTKQDALNRLINNLFEIQRGYNLDGQGKDDNKTTDRPICVAGAINKLVDTLHTIHPDVNIIYVTKQSATAKLPALVREYSIGFIKSSLQKEALLEDIACHKAVDGYPIPDAVLEAIKESVKKAFMEEFAPHLRRAELDSIFEAGYEYVTLTEDNFNDIKKSSCEEQARTLIELQLPALVKEYIINFIKTNSEKKTLIDEIVCSKVADGYLIPIPILKVVKKTIKEVLKKTFPKEFEPYVKSGKLDSIFEDEYERRLLTKYNLLTENDFNKIKMLLYKEQIELLRAHINHASQQLQEYDVTGENIQKFAALKEVLDNMLSGLIAAIDYSDNIDKDFYNRFKKDLIRYMDESELFSPLNSRLEAFRYQILIALNRLIEILSGKKAPAILSHTNFFEQKRETRASIKQDLEHFIDKLPIYRC